MDEPGQWAVAGPVPRCYGSGTLSGLAEGQLLGRFADLGDPSAFEAIVSRHGPMVLSVCRQRLRDPNDADDAFQATFLILARKAGTLRDRDALGPWLYGVAYRVARRARILADRRSRRFTVLDREPAANAGEVLDQRLIALGEEIARLPENLRSPIVLCHLEGCTYREAADRLRWSEGTVRGRLARGRDRLKDRLSRRGFAPSIEGRPCQPRPSPALMLSTLAVVANRSVAGAVPVAVSSLAGGVLRSMLLMNPKVVCSLALMLVMVSAMAVTAQDPPSKSSKSEAAASNKAEAPPDLAAVRKALDSWWETLDTLSFREVVYRPDAEGRFDPASPHGRTDFAYAHGDRFAFELLGVNSKPGIPKFLAMRKRWDGRTFYQFHPASMESDAVDSITEVVGKSEQYDGEMCSVLWLILPSGGKKAPFGSYGGRSRLEVDRDPQGHYRVSLVDDKNPQYRSELDPAHGWMPRRFQVGDEHVTTVTKFRRVADHWFPVAGTRTARSVDGEEPVTLSYEVIDLHINEPIPDSRFNRDDFPGIPVQKP
ncbi:MAG: sigma-70 family RNA polymerase sigma factor [Isosphaeraceae bacterium]